MKEGKTKTGFAYQIEEEALDDWELLEDLAALEENNPQKIVRVAKRLLSPKTYNALKDHCRGENGRVQISVMTEEIYSILHSDEDAKN